MNKLLVLVAVVLIIVVITGTAESKRPGRKRPHHLDEDDDNKRAPPPPPRRGRRPSRFPSLFRRNKNKHKTSESKKVYYYSMPPTSTHRPRVSEDLNFLDLGLLNSNSSSSNNNKTINSSPSHKHETLYDPYDDHDHLFHTDDHVTPHRRPPPPRNKYRGSRPRSPRRRPRTRGPGYRLTGQDWHNHYILHDSQENQGSGNKPPKVMDSVKRAALELRNAYKAALFQSAKMAKYTGTAAANYFKGVRNLIGGNERRKSDDGSKGVLLIPEDLDGLKIDGNSVVEEVQVPQETSNNGGGGSGGGGSSLGPNVYLDWGGSFWRLFYNKSPPQKRTSLHDDKDAI